MMKQSGKSSTVWDYRRISLHACAQDFSQISALPRLGTGKPIGANSISVLGVLLTCCALLPAPTSAVQPSHAGCSAYQLQGESVSQLQFFTNTL